jgi:DNA-binding transcriptional LysR family regulator
VADLEAEVGFKLFDRSGRRVLPTAEARLLIDEVRLAFVGLDRLKDAANAIGKYRFSQLRLVTIPSVASTIAIDLIKAFAENYPDTFVSLEVQPSDSAVEWVISQQCDLGIASPPMESPAIESRLIEEGEAVCLLPRGHRLAGEKVITPQMLADESFVSFRPDSVFRFNVDEIFRQAGVRRRLQYEARTSDAICGMVAEGMGVSIAGPFLPRLMHDDRLVSKPFRPAPQVQLALMWSTHRPMSAVARQFVELIDSYFSPASAKRARRS